MVQVLQGSAHSGQQVLLPGVSLHWSSFPYRKMSEDYTISWPFISAP
jgi:hypothetical protein